MAGKAVLLSIRPRYGEAILLGQKTLEFRRRPPGGDCARVLLYETVPVQRIVGELQCKAVHSRDPDDLWQLIEYCDELPYIERDQFDDYFDGCDVAHALEVTRAGRYCRPVALAELGVDRAAQSWRYVSQAQLDELQRLVGTPHMLTPSQLRAELSRSDMPAGREASRSRALGKIANNVSTPSEKGWSCGRR